MQLCRFTLPGQGHRLGLLAERTAYDLTASGWPALATLSALLQASITTPIEALLKDVDLTELPGYAYADLDSDPTERSPHLLPPADRQEVWAAGVTYAWSREARVREAQTKDVYVRVYEAERPELFFKCPGEKAVGPNDWIGLRGDSRWNVPEPELTLVLNPALQIVGYTVGNDVSSRDIEGENPLYLPQAKIYRHACALGPAITLARQGLDPQSLSVRLTIYRDSAVVFQGQTSTARMHRRPAELARYLGRYNDFPQGVLLMTGTGIVPPDDFTLQDGDDVLIEIEGVGTLRNPVKQM
ncbi:MAG: fumarylacetoacetate hydrolase family protein [Anaerolineae bacterium]|nr:MAG: fumarylacetoacetate hydrolase family protein [Anaerolineae bacterium]